MRELTVYKNWNTNTNASIDLLELGEILNPRLILDEDKDVVYLCGWWCINPRYMAELWGIRPKNLDKKPETIEELRDWATENGINVDWDSVEIINGNFYYPACAYLEDYGEIAEISDWVCEGEECLDRFNF